MEEENKRRIQGNYKDLVDNVRPVDIQDYLVQAGVLSDEEQNLISLPSIVPQEGLFHQYYNHLFTFRLSYHQQSLIVNMYR